MYAPKHRATQEAVSQLAGQTCSLGEPTVYSCTRSHQAHTDPRPLVYQLRSPQVLSSLKRLVSLSLSGNPILAETAHFRKTVITASPKLRYATPIFGG